MGWGLRRGREKGGKRERKGESGGEREERREREERERAERDRDAYEIEAAGTS
jgi:hypothetical protein